MEKNVTVIDEQGHEYGATYPKRAKGLIKNGRARFVDEHTICLACPPNEILEDTEMSETVNYINQREIWEQIVKLQAELSNVRDSVANIGCVNESLLPVTENGDTIEDSNTVFYNPEVALAKIKNIREIFEMREKTLNELLNFYKMMYENTLGEKNRQVNTIKSSFDHVLSFLPDSQMEPQDRFAFMCDCTERISDMILQAFHEPNP